MRRIWIVALVLAPAAHSATAQVLPDAQVAEIQARISTHPVRAWTTWGPFVLEGVRLSPTALAYEHVRSDTTFLRGTITFPPEIALQDISTLAIQKKRPMVWAVRAGVAFGLVGALIGALDTSNNITCATCRRTGLTPVRGALIFGGIGVGIGVFSGLVVPGWHTIYRNPVVP